ncbi:unnamed protein product [Leptidea sinapis]|uniref:Transporter n=1 Tax=Leptidea sinapis TaxID=189913 RepID=A0A5E4QKU9_9NEOP|nr:unnamed protein product [Leptidea sinapis]
MEKRAKTSISAVTNNVIEMDNTHSDCREMMLRDQHQEDSEPERGNWTGRFDFLLSLLGYSVGLGNVWRFPYLCYNNGGGAFLIPFTVMLIIAGLPLMFMELSFGQYAALGPVAVYNRFCPLFRGLDCYSYEAADECEANNGTYYLRQCFNQTQAALHNISALANVTLRRPPAEEYFSNHVLGLSSGIQEIGGVRWSLAICLFAAWLIVFLCLCKGVQSSGKVVYFTALFPYVVLVILFFRGVTLPGASTGILFYLTPDFSQLANAQVWGDAAVQIFFALSPAWGGLITLSSYNKFSNNCYLDSLIVAVSNIATSFFAGLVIFSVIGFLAHELEVEVDRVVDQGAGLAFIVYPEVFALMETVTTAILDRFPNFRERKIWVVLTVAIFGYLGGLIFTTNSGMYWLQLMDKYAANWSVLIIAIGECILIAWIYGAEKFCHDIERMIGRQSQLWLYFWSTMWRGITPAALIFILAFNWIEYKPATYGHYVYPMWADAVGWIVGMLPILVVVLMAIDKICTGPDDLTIMQKARFLSQPTEEWGPALRSSVPMPPQTELSPPVLLLHGRHTSRDVGDNTSTNSSMENVSKKFDLTTKKRNSFKKKVNSYSHESDDVALVPLLQTVKTKSDVANQSAKQKLLMKKIKTDSIEEREPLTNENDIEIGKFEKNMINILPVRSETSFIDNHMVVNGSGSPSTTKDNTTLGGFTTRLNEKQFNINVGPVIFTTAKIHTDNKSKPIDHVNISPGPILSTSEGLKLEIIPSSMKSPDERLNKSSSSKINIAEVSVQKQNVVVKNGVLGNEAKEETEQKIITKSSLNKIVEIDPKEKELHKEYNTTKNSAFNEKTDLSIYEKSSSNDKDIVNYDIADNIIVNKNNDKLIPTSGTSIRSMGAPNLRDIKSINSSSSVKKLQRQKNAKVEDSGNSALSIPTNNSTNPANIKTEVKASKAIDASLVINEKSLTEKNVVLKSTSALVNTKVIKTGTLDPSINADKSNTAVTIGSKASSIATCSFSTATSKQSNITKPTTSVSTTNSNVKMSSVPAITSTAVIESKKIDKRLSLRKDFDHSEELSKVCKQSNTAADTATKNTPPYIVATSKTKIGGTITYNTPGVSKPQNEKSSTQVVSSVKLSPAANVTKSVEAKKPDVKQTDSKPKRTISKS